jgi:hypothetical protein
VLQEQTVAEEPVDWLVELIKPARALQRGTRSPRRLSAVASIDSCSWYSWAQLGPAEKALPSAEDRGQPLKPYNSQYNVQLSVQRPRRAEFTRCLQWGVRHAWLRLRRLFFVCFNSDYCHTAEKKSSHAMAY